MTEAVLATVAAAVLFAAVTLGMLADVDEAIAQAELDALVEAGYPLNERWEAKQQARHYLDWLEDPS